MPLTIGPVANAADVNVQTIRYYERRGLVPTPRRTRSGYRQYTDDAVARLRFIMHAQELGFSLQEVQELLAWRVRHGAAGDVVERKTRRLAAACAVRRPTAECPILEVLEDHGDASH